MAMIWRGFESISPSGGGIFDVNGEPFDVWHPRVMHRIPHVPPCVAENWLHRHWGLSPYYWLPLARLRFEKQRWANAKVLGIGEGLEPRWSPGWGEELGRQGSVHNQMWLGRYMLEHRTWPAPIIVLDNSAGLVDPFGERLARFHLIEGHMRSAFHHHLATHGLARDEHEVWLTAIAEPKRRARRPAATE